MGHLLARQLPTASYQLPAAIAFQISIYARASHAKQVRQRQGCIMKAGNARNWHRHAHPLLPSPDVFISSKWSCGWFNICMQNKWRHAKSWKPAAEASAQIRARLLKWIQNEKRAALSEDRGERNNVCLKKTRVKKERERKNTTAATTMRTAKRILWILCDWQRKTKTNEKKCCLLFCAHKARWPQSVRLCTRVCVRVCLRTGSTLSGTLFANWLSNFN